MQEMLIIGIAALLIFGPGKLPEVMGQAGKLYRDFRNMTSELTGEFEKTVAEAKDAANQLTGDMQKQVNSVTASVQRDLGTGSKTTNTSKLKGASPSSSTAKKTTTTSSKSGTTSSRSTTSSSTSSSRTSPSTSKTTTSSSSTAKPAPIVASKEDPFADVSVFELAAPERPRRARKATPSVITDPTPRTTLSAMTDGEADAAIQAVVADDPLARARQRRKNAGYAQRSA
jgi:TatA/E family protein of Tat protein translocase